MYLKTLTLRGFKSFASATTMRLEPGITCVVGPNGSGKSNVVDALAWVMGEQGAKSLRGGKMEDVIFAGTAGRPPLGRAEVSLTIDNADGALPIDYTEVTITRTMFRGGGSEYAINGTACRLLDVQELLSDSGLGREMHVIVGQGQLDTVLRATPEERRGFIEEAAGVLKHRRRKERTLRKLEQMEGNLTRVQDLTGEIRRQLGPLGRQAEAARRAAVVQAEVRDARLRLLADDLVQVTSILQQEVADETALLERRTAVEEAVAAVRSRLGEVERQAAEAAPELGRAQERVVRLQSLRDRLESTASVAAERVRLLSQDEEHETTSGRDPEELRAQAAQAREAEALLQAEIAETTEALQAAVTAREEAEQAFAAEQQRLARLARAAADRREGLAKLAGQVGARRSRIEAGEAEIGRLRELAVQARERASEAEAEFASLEGSIAHDEEGEEGLDTSYEASAQRLAAAEAEIERHEADERAAERDRASAQARLEALELSLRRKDGAATLLEAGEEAHGILGAVSALVHVSGGHEAAVAAALGWASEALAVGSADEAAAALAALRSADGGRAALLVGATATPSDPASWPALEGDAVWARDVVSAPDTVLPAVHQVLERVALVPTSAHAVALVARYAGVTAVTREGDVFGPGWARGGSAAGESLLEVQAALEETRADLQDASARLERSRFALAAAREQAAAVRTEVDTALEALHESDARMAAVAERLGTLGASVRTSGAEAERAERAIAAAEETLEADRTELAALAERLEQAEAEPAPEDSDPSTDERDRLELEASRARTGETEVRLALRTTEERARALAGRADSLEGAARNEIAARERLRERRETRRREAAVAAAVHEAADWAGRRVATALARAGALREAAETERAERDRAAATLREELGRVQDELRDLTDAAHRDEMARARQLARIEQLQAKAVEELGIDPDVLAEEFGPHQPVPHVPGPDDDPDALPDPVPFVRAEQEKRLRRAERALGALGKVNPLALEEYAALEERHTFLTTQLEDLKRSKRDLLDIVKEVDERVEQVFREAFHDTKEQFERVFERLFPGGEGRLVLTDPDEMLTTGIEVEARPPGKKVKRLSLLSGGERSLVAVALLVAIFKARPSPFYIMDEVEAALDDTNLGRLITLFEELRDSSQLIVITHQKRTMEVADALYGVSMRGDGVTTVVSQRLRDVAATA
ncbi:chromosome segregation protein SMC [Phycicoccus endophyticus]|uniref:Chromosome partition protein Smc n=1 Tax=Phycicoccus endophyticus TaxID=1690220 RepID=A0A7G9QYA0_9MICO|nr:chromosome segregation protein SMC [Phycicoccus endophyticus]NHI19216.1 chromosome segregation protein SMC [Phycicoccus endophyticus]QNN48325.1 chromosome segregation protein SMC [Phycicoccus endophyticus]GGL41039.1 chromosome partition protein Smc [Phycicoccus endophyticus]